jgi:predicted SprT family Zn-dependent metalloprotease
MTEVMKFVEVLRLGNALMREHGLTELGWKFDLDSGKQRIGCCHYSTKTITYSKHFLVDTSMAKIRDVILHEIAHALTPNDKGHGWEWKMKCIEIGARPERLDYESVRSKQASKPNYVIECDACGRRWTRYRLKPGYLNGYFHSSCCGATMTVYRVRSQ